MGKRNNKSERGKHNKETLVIMVLALLGILILNYSVIEQNLSSITSNAVIILTGNAVRDFGVDVANDEGVNVVSVDVDQESVSVEEIKNNLNKENLLNLDKAFSTTSQIGNGDPPRGILTPLVDGVVQNYPWFSYLPFALFVFVILCNSGYGVYTYYNENEVVKTKVQKSENVVRIYENLIYYLLLPFTLMISFIKSLKGHFNERKIKKQNQKLLVAKLNKWKELGYDTTQLEKDVLIAQSVWVTFVNKINQFVRISCDLILLFLNLFKSGIYFVATRFEVLLKLFLYKFYNLNLSRFNHLKNKEDVSENKNSENKENVFLNGDLSSGSISISNHSSNISLSNIWGSFTKVFQFSYNGVANIANVFERMLVFVRDAICNFFSLVTSSIVYYSRDFLSKSLVPLVFLIGSFKLLSKAKNKASNFKGWVNEKKLNYLESGSAVEGDVVECPLAKEVNRLEHELNNNLHKGIKWQSARPTISIVQPKLKSSLVKSKLREIKSEITDNVNSLSDYQAQIEAELSSCEDNFEARRLAIKKSREYIKQLREN